MRPFDRPFGWDLPPGVNVSDVPGSRPEDAAWEKMMDDFYVSLGESDKKVFSATQEVYDITSKAIEFGIELGKKEQIGIYEENKFYDSQHRQEVRIPKLRTYFRKLRWGDDKEVTHVGQVFVDCDNTLVLYEDKLPHYYGILHGDSYKPNSELIDRLKKFPGTIIVWSGGGRDYARQVAELVLPKDLKYFTMSKFQFEAWCVLKEGDIVVDDQKELFTAVVSPGVRVLGPFDAW